MKKLILIVVMLLITGCSAVWDEDKLVVSFFSGAVSGSIDPNSGTGNWTRVGDYKASGIEILKDDGDYAITFDTSESRTEFDKMKFFFEAGVAAGKKVVVP